MQIDLPVWPFVLATLVGEIPTAAIYASFGAGLGRVLGGGRRPGMESLHDPMILAPMAGLALLAFSPSLIRWLRRRMARS